MTDSQLSQLRISRYHADAMSPSLNSSHYTLENFLLLWRTCMKPQMEETSWKGLF